MPPTRKSRRGMFRGARRQKPRRQLATKTFVKRAVARNTEVDASHQVVAATNAAFDSAAINNLDFPPTATTSDLIEVKSIDYRLILRAQTTADTIVRIVIFQWFQDENNVAPILADIMEGTPSATTILAPTEMNAGTTKIFKVIRDFVVRLGHDTAVEGNSIAYRRIRLFPKSLPRKMFRPTTTSLGFNNIYLMAFSDIANASAPPTITWQAKTEFKMVSKN